MCWEDGVSLPLNSTQFCDLLEVLQLSHPHCGMGKRGTPWKLSVVGTFIVSPASVDLNTFCFEPLFPPFKKKSKSYRNVSKYVRILPVLYRNMLFWGEKEGSFYLSYREKIDI